MRPNRRLLETGGVRLLEGGGARLLENTPGAVAGVLAVPDGGRCWPCPDGGRCWRVAVDEKLSCGTLFKTAGDRRYFTFELGDVAEMIGGQTVTAATITADGTGLTIGAADRDGYTVGAWFSGGTGKTTYKVTMTATLSGGGTLARTGTLRVE